MRRVTEPAALRPVMWYNPCVMSVETLIGEIEKLSKDELNRLLDAILRMREPSGSDLTPAQQADLLKRIEEDASNPEQGEAWDAVRTRIERRGGFDAEADRNAASGT